MIIVSGILFVLAAIKAATWLTVGPGYWFWGFLAFAAWVLAGVFPVWTPGRRQAAGRGQ